MSDYAEVACPNCRHSLRVRLEYAGRKIACKYCGQAFRFQPEMAAPSASLSSPSVGGPVTTEELTAAIRERDHLLAELQKAQERIAASHAENLSLQQEVDSLRNQAPLTNPADTGKQQELEAALAKALSDAGAARCAWDSEREQLLEERRQALDEVEQRLAATVSSATNIELQSAQAQWEEERARLLGDIEAVREGALVDREQSSLQARELEKQLAEVRSALQQSEHGLQELSASRAELENLRGEASRSDELRVSLTQQVEALQRTVEQASRQYEDARATWDVQRDELTRQVTGAEATLSQWREEMTRSGIDLAEAKEKAKEAELTALEANSAWSRERESLQAEAAERANALQSAEQQVASLQATLADLEQRLAARDGQLAERETALSSLQASQADRSAELSAEVARLQEAVNQGEAERAQLAEELQGLRAQVASDSDSHSAAQTQLADVSSQLSQAREQCQRFAAEVARLEGERTGQENTQANLQAKFVASEEAQAAANRECQALREQIASLEDQLRSAQAHGAEIAGDTAGWHDRHAHVQRELAAIQEELARASGELAAAQQSSEGYERELARARSEIAHLRGEQSELQSRLSEAEARISAAGPGDDLQAVQSELHSVMEKETEHQHELTKQKAAFDQVAALYQREIDDLRNTLRSMGVYMD